MDLLVLLLIVLVIGFSKLIITGIERLVER